MRISNSSAIRWASPRPRTNGISARSSPAPTSPAAGRRMRTTRPPNRGKSAWMTSPPAITRISPEENGATSSPQTEFPRRIGNASSAIQKTFLLRPPPIMCVLPLPRLLKPFQARRALNPVISWSAMEWFPSMPDISRGRRIFHPAQAGECPRSRPQRIGGHGAALHSGDFTGCRADFGLPLPCCIQPSLHIDSPPAADPSACQWQGVAPRGFH